MLLWLETIRIETMKVKISFHRIEIQCFEENNRLFDFFLLFIIVIARAKKRGLRNMHANNSYKNKCNFFDDADLGALSHNNSVVNVIKFHDPRNRIYFG